MCQPATCQNCRRTTWSGCGQHIDQVMRSVPSDRRCTCSPADRQVKGLWSRLLGR